MARIHKINGYLIDPNGDYNADNIEIGITERSGLDVFSQHLHVETAECGVFWNNHPLNKVDCDLAECEKYFPKQSIAHGVIDTILHNVAKQLEELKAYKEKEFDVLKQDGQLLYKQGIIDGYDKAIDDFVEKAIEEQIQYDCPLDKHDIEKIAEQLKAGGGVNDRTGSN